MKIISWNMAHRFKAWHALLNSGADIALLQEASTPPRDLAERISTDSEPWLTPGNGTMRQWRTAVVGLNGKVGLNWFTPKVLDQCGSEDLGVSRPGTLSAAEISYPGIDPFIAVSIYGLWERPHSSTLSRRIYADASVHRLISDLSAFIGRQYGHRILVAGDLNVLNRYGERGSAYWAARYSTVFDRMEALGLDYIGPQQPNGRKAEPRAEELPEDSKDVPTFYCRGQTPETATRQLDFVFASRGFSETVHVQALNDPNGWGTSDHCMVEIGVGE